MGHNLFFPRRAPPSPPDAGGKRPPRTPRACAARAPCLHEARSVPAWDMPRACMGDTPAAFHRLKTGSACARAAAPGRHITIHHNAKTP